MKDLGWLKEEAEKLDKETSQNYPHEETVELPSVLRLIDQLDELGYSSEDMTNYYRDGYKAGIEDEKSISKTKLPEIPDYVAEYLEYAKSDTTLMRVMELANTRREWDKWNREYDWIEEYHERFARAWLDGYTVEEKKYVVPLGELHALCKLTDDTVDIYKEDSDKLHLDDDFIFTEQEIKDYDERYWAFAVPVKELEE